MDIRYSDTRLGILNGTNNDKGVNLRSLRQACFRSVSNRKVRMAHRRLDPYGMSLVSRTSHDDCMRWGGQRTSDQKQKEEKAS
uniref:Uncharacterized protein n=1 Tax=Physcomitrium patens TaxID=3218 RepID=A0A2K1IFY5_PHYPA|nr:hypothetical protein PHYPA_028782 [Physcomitrium patens]